MIGLLKQLRHDRRGQSLVETAIMMPILLILMLGIVEVSNLLVTQNRVTTAARQATGFGASHFVGSEWDNTATWSGAMARVAQNTVSETLDLDAARWDIYTVKATVDTTGTGFSQWTAIHAWGNEQVFSQAAWAAREPQIQQDILDALTTTIGVDGLQLVSTVAYHDRESLLGIGAFGIDGLNRVRGLNVMRVGEPPPYAVCDAYPIAISMNNQSLWPYDPNNDPPYGEESPINSDWKIVGSSYYRDMATRPKPVYEVGNTSEFPRNVPGIEVYRAQPGYLYNSKESTESGASGGSGSATFGWLCWDDLGSCNAGNLATSLAYPGNAHTYRFLRFPGAGVGSEDGGLNRYDLVALHGGSVAKSEVKNNLEQLTNAGRTAKLIVFTPPSLFGGDANSDGYKSCLKDNSCATGSAQYYEVFGFAVFRIIAWELPGNNNWLVSEFLRWDDTCN